MLGEGDTEGFWGAGSRPREWLRGYLLYNYLANLPSMFCVHFCIYVIFYNKN